MSWLSYYLRELMLPQLPCSLRYLLFHYCHARYLQRHPNRLPLLPIPPPHAHESQLFIYSFPLFLCSLSGCGIDDTLLALLAPGIASSHSSGTLEELDLSFNAISSEGVTAYIAPLLQSPTCGIQRLNLMHNRIGADARGALAAAIRANHASTASNKHTLTHLNLRLNDYAGLTDDSGAFEGLPGRW